MDRRPESSINKMKTTVATDALLEAIVSDNGV